MENIPGIVLSSIKPKKPPTNILVVRSTCSTWSSSTIPEQNTMKVVQLRILSKSMLRLRKLCSDILFMYL